MFRRMFQSVRRSTILRRTIVGGTIAVGTLEITTHLPSEGRSSEFYHFICDDIVTPMMRKALSPEHAHEVAIQFLSFHLNNDNNNNNNNNNNDQQQSQYWAFLKKHLLPSLSFCPTHRPSAKEQRLNMITQISSTSSSSILQFDNPIGLAAGFDKDGVAIQSLFDLGFGFVEIGSVTLHPQPGNPSPRMFRLVNSQAIINRYGFNSLGAHQVQEYLHSYRQKQQQNQQNQQNSGNAGILGVNLGLNKTSTTPIQDYQTLIQILGPYADYLVINVSSPNTPGLRDLQFDLENLLTACIQARDSLLKQSQENEKENDNVDGGKNNNNAKMLYNKNNTLPLLFVKLSPDLTNQQLQQIAAVLQKVGIDGMIVTNTTTQRPSLSSSTSLSTSYENDDNNGDDDSSSSPSSSPFSIVLSPQDKEYFHQVGGLSGRPLKDRSTECIRLLYKYTNGSIPIIGVGGIFTGQDAYEKLTAGASLVQIYTGMVYRGPGTVSKIRNELADILIQNGQRRLQEDVVGNSMDHEDLYWKKRIERLESSRHSEKIFVALEDNNDENESGSGSSDNNNDANANANADTDGGDKHDAVLSNDDNGET